MIPAEVFAISQSSGIYYAFQHSDAMGKGIVILLFVFSVFTWTIMLEKGIALGKARRDCLTFIRRFREKHNPLAYQDRIEEEPSPAARVCETAYERIAHFGLELPEGGRRALEEEEIGIVRSSMEQAVEDQVLELESKMIFLGTAITISPFLGLFGTVWGIMLAFTDLAIVGKASIQSLAPGVSGALLTTVLGLFVAIPSVVGYNIITNRIKSTIVCMDNFVEEFIVKLKIEQMDSFRK